MMKNPDSQDPEENHERRQPVAPFSQPLLAETERVPGNDDSRKNANTPSIASVCPITPPANCEKLRPVGAELKLHRDAGDHADRES